MFENCIKDKFVGLNKINEIDANYVKRALKEHEQSMGEIK